MGTLLEQLAAHPLPTWWQDAKLGIFVHWTMASVPAYAPIGRDPFALAREEGEWAAFAKTPYVEWYQNSVAIPGSPAAEHHRTTYGDRPYDAFRDEWTAAHAGWDAGAWAELFARAGAAYCVMVTKHHDGYCLWPTEVPNPHRPGWASARDLVGECAAAVRAAGIRFGTYYSGGLDWTFQGLGIQSWQTLFAAIPQSPEYHAYADAHWRELMDRYSTEMLWNDIGYPGFGPGAEQLMADFYARTPYGVVNDRFDIIGTRTGTAHADFVTPEYSSGPPPEGRAFEVCRGIGTSFGYNALETEASYLAAADLVRLFVDIVADGGNLLLNVGPMASGAIPWAQRQRLLALGDWLAVNEPAIRGSQPAATSRGATTEGITVRYTRGADGATYAIVCGRPSGAVVEIAGLPAGEVTLLGHYATLHRQGDAVWLPARPDDVPAWTLRLGPVTDRAPGEGVAG